MKEWVQVLRAADAAGRWHVHQRRKGAAEEPYINHLLEVAMLAPQDEGLMLRSARSARLEAPVSRPSLVIAALLH